MTLFFTHSVLAQSKFHVGVRGTANYYDISGDLQNMNTKNSLGYSAGLTSRYDFTPRLYVQLDVAYSQQRSAVEQNKTPDIKALEFPLIAGFRFIKYKKASVQLFGGLGYKYLLNENDLALNQAILNEGGSKKSNAFVRAGVGVSVSKFTVDFTFGRNLSAVSESFNSRSNNIIIGVGYFIF